MCHRKVMSFAAPRCVFCGEPLREGVVHWTKLNEQTLQAQAADNERAQQMAATEAEEASKRPPPLPRSAGFPEPYNFQFRGEEQLVVRSPFHEFVFPQYLGRLAYFGRQVMLVFVLMMAAFWLTNGLPGPVGIVATVVLVLAAKAYQVVVLGRARARDIGQNEWFALLLLVPIVGIGVALYLLFAPTGTDA